VGGQTLHSFAGILDFERPKVKLAEGLWKWQKFKENFTQTDTLLVDEVSMVDCATLEKVCVQQDVWAF
jgi:ATP-dependent exoDNAse (exonuclease V) alpha subunit